MLILFVAGCVLCEAQPVAPSISRNYLSNRKPLHENRFIELPLGAIMPGGWLKEMLVRQKNGSTGQLDKLYPLVMNETNGWLGGQGDQWERGPYWIDGLLPLAYILKDSALIAKTKPWIEWAIHSQRRDGYFGPDKDYPSAPGLQRNNSSDWWPRMVMLKILRQYYGATQDKRVIKLLTHYFRYQLRRLPETPLDHWTSWARFRAGDNLSVIYWLYNITGDRFLLSLAEIMHRQTFNYTDSFLNSDMLSRNGSIHGVNLAQGMKEPLLYYQHHHDARYLKATKKAFADLRKYDETPNGMFGGDEALHGNNPTQGSELCTAVEMMFTLESILPVSGDVEYADRLEKIAFNALPSQTTGDYMNRQYFQQANQVMITRHARNFDINHDGTDLCYGLLTGYACCTSNMHQGWPKFTQNLWYATPDNGLAALLYSPCEVNALAGNGKKVSIREETDYPFGEIVKFMVTLSGNSKPVGFPLYLRIPQWCTVAAIKINGRLWKREKGGQITKLYRCWTSGDTVELVLPMHIFNNTWHENAVSVERGPLTYSLKIKEEMKKIVNEKDSGEFGSSYYEVVPASPWNYALEEARTGQLDDHYTVKEKPEMATYPWSPESSPVEIRTGGKRVPSWKLYEDMAGPLPYSITYHLETGPEEQIVLIPYGCTRLHISEFPVVGSR